jgi:hypothetical protein
VGPDSKVDIKVDIWLKILKQDGTCLPLVQISFLLCHGWSHLFEWARAPEKPFKAFIASQDVCVKS